MRTLKVSILGIAVLLIATAALSQSAFTIAYRYDAARQLVGTIMPNAGSGYPAVRNTYDPEGRITKIERGYLSAWQAESVPPASWPNFVVLDEIDTTYDVVGHLITDKHSSGTGANPTLTQSSYDGLGRLECTAVRMNASVYSSLPASACTLSTQGPDGPDRIRRLVYDAAGEVLNEQHAYATGAQQNFATYAYTPNGRRDWVEDASGNLSDFTYDGFDRLSRLNFPQSTVGAQAANANDYEQYGYDGDNNLTSLRRRSGETIFYQFDGLNRMHIKDLPGSSTDVYYGYDLQSNQLYARFGSDAGLGVTNVFDGLGRLTSTTSSSSSDSLQVSFQYDNDSNRTRVTWPDSTYVQYTYDALDRMNQVLENGAASGPGLLASYSNDMLGRRTGITRGNGTASSYSFDGVSRISSLAQDLASTSGDVTFGFTYNSASQVTQRTVSNDSYSYFPLPKSTSYTPDGLNRYANVAGAAFSYDGRGNLTSDGSRSFTYDVENHLLSVSGPTSVTLTYDPLGRLLTTTSGSTTTRYLYEGERLIAEYNGGTLLRRYAHGAGLDEPLVWYEGAGLTDRRWLHTDHQGSVIATSDGAGDGTLYAYGAYGEPAYDNWSGSRFRYTGQVMLGEAKLYHYKARVYDPSLGMFLQTDPVGYSADLNLYAYASDDPLDLVDPLGLRNCDPDQKDTNCVETPESAKSPGPPPPQAPETQKMEQVVVKAHHDKKDSDGKKIIFSDGDEHGHYVTLEGFHRATLTPVTEVKCPGDNPVVVNLLRRPRGSTPSHTHPDSYGAPGSVPGPGDDRGATQSASHTAFMETSSHVFTIEAMSDGTFRTTVSGPPLSDAQRTALISNMQQWESAAAHDPTASLKQEVCKK
jgi:RHS repeat-associated protein